MKRNVLITGSSSGIGAGTAVAFAAEGYNVGINYKMDAEGAAISKEKCESLGAETVVIQGDVSNRDEAANLVNQFIDHFGKIDVLVNNAGGGLKMPKGEFIDMPLDYWDSQIALNLNAAVYCSQPAVRDMIAKKRQDVSSISAQSMVSKRGFVGR